MNNPADMPLFLIGPRGCGKTTLARELALYLGWKMIDTDQSIREQSGLTVAELVEKEGWAGFRRREAAALRAATAPGTVIATGGGMVLLPENRKFLHTAGRVFYLEASVHTLCERLRRSPEKAQRPSLTGQGLVEETAEVLRERVPLYKETAHHILRADQPLPALLEAAIRILESV